MAKYIILNFSFFHQILGSHVDSNNKKLFKWWRSEQIVEIVEYVFITWLFGLISRLVRLDHLTSFHFVLNFLSYLGLFEDELWKINLRLFILRIHKFQLSFLLLRLLGRRNFLKSRFPVVILEILITTFVQFLNHLWEMIFFLSLYWFSGSVLVWKDNLRWLF